MTDNEILDETLRLAIPRYLDRIKPNKDFTRQGCIDEAVKVLEFEFRFSRRIGLFKELTIQESDEFDALVSRLMPLMDEQASAAETEYRKGQMEKGINRAKAESIIVPAFERFGFKVSIEYYKFKAYLKVRLSDEDWTMFWVPYEDLYQEGYIDGLVATASSLRNSIIRRKKKDGRR